MQETNWVVITGGPSSGKSTLLEYLESQGYQIVPESARMLIEAEAAKGKTLKEIRSDETAFQRQVLGMKVGIEEKLNPDELIFFDRGIPDSIAYYQICGGDATSVLRESQKRRYKAVFLCEQVPFAKDHARTEDQR